MADDPMEKLAKLAKRIAAEAAIEGFDTQRIAALPDPTGGPGHIELLFTLNEDWTPPDPEADLFAALEQDMALDKQKEKATEAHKGLADLQEKLDRPNPGEGFL